jgi:hypothetical protein
MLLTALWVKQNFNKEYLEENQKLQDLNGWVDIQNPEANPTRKIRNVVVVFCKGLKAKDCHFGELQQLNKRGVAPLMVILRLKMICS